ncbi:amino acid deaminase [Microbacterium sp. NPDC089698]|uniref:amino acid deaminase n=1 Tax=Microbacterium sp. NPDC089698 TaxID=3364200 RepID=UPI0038269747
MQPIDDLERAAFAATVPAPDAAEQALASIDWLVAAIETDREEGRFSLWGLSTVVDENTTKAVLDRPLFDALHKRAGLVASWPVGNAGLLHTYGYLLSLAPTPYGLKRERWLGDDLATALDLSDRHFMPWDGPRTLLARATDAALNLLASGGEFSSDAVTDGRATRAVLGHERNNSRALAYSVASAAGAAPALVTLFPVSHADTVLDTLKVSPACLLWNAI